MLDKIKKALFLGIGIASLTTKEIDKKVRGLVKDGILSEKEGKEILKKLIAEARKHKQRIEEIAVTKTKKQIKELNALTRGELGKLIRRVGSLEKSLRELAKKEVKKVAKTVLKEKRSRKR